ncbi:MAG: alpha/beta fold hydrolase [Alphaproteobacteria bacterium]|nr:MAG: alpha/beta fold hydrolase [Alphaproteobacteria bacterium]
MDLKVDGRKVHAATGGRPFESGKPAVVFLHGAGCDHTVWQLPARWFAWHGHAALAVDLPGHGRSEGPPLASIGDMGRWVGALLDAAGVRQAALVGHSMGAAAALEAAVLMPERVTRMGLVGTAAAIPVHRDLLAAAKEEPERAYQMMTAWAHGTAAKLGGHPVPGLWMTGGTLALFARNRPGVLHADLEACHAWKSGPEAARKVRCPALVIIAANDIMTPAKAGQELARLVADSRSITVQNCGHMLPAEAPDAVLDALIDFFAPISADAR